MTTNRTEHSDYKPGMRNIKLRLKLSSTRNFFGGRGYFYYSQAFNYLVTLIVQTAVKDKKNKMERANRSSKFYTLGVT